MVGEFPGGLADQEIHALSNEGLGSALVIGAKVATIPAGTWGVVRRLPMMADGAGHPGGGPLPNRPALPSILELLAEHLLEERLPQAVSPQHEPECVVPRSAGVALLDLAILRRKEVPSQCLESVTEFSNVVEGKEALGPGDDLQLVDSQFLGEQTAQRVMLLQEDPPAGRDIEAVIDE